VISFQIIYKYHHQVQVTHASLKWWHIKTTITFFTMKKF